MARCCSPQPSSSGEPELAWERDEGRELCGTPRRWQVAPWLTHRSGWTGPTLCPCSLFIRLVPFLSERDPIRPSRWMQRNARGLPSDQPFRPRQWARPTSCTAALKPWLKRFLLGDWLGMQKLKPTKTLPPLGPDNNWAPPTKPRLQMISEVLFF